jgi:ElaB/YqjD/DUF883 family membrane-anchored ribosome-binding protein
MTGVDGGGAVDQSTGQQINEKVSEYQRALADRGEELRERFDDLDVRTRKFVRERPFVAVGAALAAGYVLARLIARR